MSLKLYDAIYSLQRFFSDELGVRANWVYDGYQYPEEKPFMTIETLTDERTVLSKGREAVQVIEHLQIGYHATNIVDRTKRAEEIADLLTFKKVPYFDTEKSVVESDGYFLCDLTGVVPMMADETNRKSEYNRVYFDVEIENIKRGC